MSGDQCRQQEYMQTGSIKYYAPFVMFMCYATTNCSVTAVYSEMQHVLLIQKAQLHPRG